MSEVQSKEWGAPWLAKEVRLVEEMRARGLTYKQIAPLVGRPWASVKSMCQRERLTGRAWRLGLRYLPLVTVPHRLEDVARALGVKVSAVWKAKWMLGKAGFPVVPAIRREPKR